MCSALVGSISRCDWGLCWPSGQEHMAPFVHSPKPHTSHLPFLSFLQVWKNVLAPCSLADTGAHPFLQTFELTLAFVIVQKERAGNFGAGDRKREATKAGCKAGANTFQTLFGTRLSPGYVGNEYERVGRTAYASSLQATNRANKCSR